ncbi:MAG: hypothetical protein CVU18_14200 [Betaproteobacteria bacterium HGW-Betaproteobacteria-12]|nr:MAG: hypothetical protein CVU18_14200 [Betaproteobacteria bacterium HGW-Betaproteobacteria-12]
MRPGQPLSPHRRIHRIAGLVFVLLLLGGAGAAYFLERHWLAADRARATETARQKIHLIDRQLDHGLSVTHALAGLIRLGQGEIENFDAVARELLTHYPGVSALQLAPDGVIRQAVPLAGHEAAIGHDLLRDELRNKEARLAIETRRLTVAGPVRLIQGGDAILGRLPVYVEAAGGDFWGFAIALIQLDDFRRAIDLDSLGQQGYAYQLWRPHPDSGAPQVFAQSAGPMAAEPVTTALDIPNGRWFLSVAPEQTWLNTNRLAAEVLLVLLVALLASLGLHWYWRVRQERADNELRYRSLYEATPAMMHSIDGDGHIVSVSQTWLETLGYRRDEVIGRKSTDFLTAESRRHALEQVLPEFFRTGRCTAVPYQMLARDGRVLDVLLSAYGERNREGKVIRSLAVIEDVTERKQNELRLHQLLAEQKAIIENDLVGILRVRDRIIVWANPAYETMLGYQPGELNGRPTQQTYPDADAHRAFGAAAYPVLAAGGVYHAQFEQRDKAGRSVWLNVSGAMLDRDSGESLWAFVDITELKLALSRIGRSEQRMDLALAGADLGMWDWHIPSGEFTCNRRMLEMLGYAGDELVLNNDSYAALINLADLPGVRQTLVRHFKGELPLYEAEYRLRHKDERWLWILCRGRVVQWDDNGRAVRMTGTNLDISERKANEERIRSREARLANLISSMQDLVIVFDAGGSPIEYFYPPDSRHPYRLPGDPRGGNYVEMLPDDVAHRFADTLGELLTDGRPGSIEYTLDVAGESLVSVALLSPIIADPGSFPEGYLGVVRDVTSERLAQQKIASLSRRNTLLLESAGEGIYGVDQAGRITFINSKALHLMGFSESEVIGRSAYTLFHHEQDEWKGRAESECPVARTLRDGEPRYVDSAYFWHNDSHGIPVSLNVAPIVENGVRQGAVVVFQDITERRRAEEAIRHLAFYDPLTQLPNRRLLNDRLSRALANGKRSALPGALFFVDLDNFKNLNDRLGHDIGDLLLQQVAERLSGCLREVDTVARFGGDEFVLLCEGLDADPAEATRQAERIGNKVLATLTKPYLLGTYLHASTPSIGVTLFIGGGKSAEQVLKEADMAMYQAKGAGRNTLRVFASPLPVAQGGAETTAN